MGIIFDKEEREMALKNLDELRNEMLNKLDEMEQIIRELSGDNYLIWERARSYWHTSITNNLSADSGDFLGSMVNFQNTYDELKEHCECESKEDEDENI